MAMVQPFSGHDPSVANRRQLMPLPEIIRNQDPKMFPPVYIFNCGPRRIEFTPGDRGPRFVDPCPEGRACGKPLIIKRLVNEPYDLADGGGNMGWCQEDGMVKARALVNPLNEDGKSPSLYTSNMEWFGVFVSENQEPTAAELKKAKAKLVLMMQMIYDRGSETISQNEATRPEDRKIYNEAAVFLGLKPLYGTQDHIAEGCVFCHESIKAGAVKCKHCNERLDSPEAKKLKAEKAAV